MTQIGRLLVLLIFFKTTKCRDVKQEAEEIRRNALPDSGTELNYWMFERLVTLEILVETLTKNVGVISEQIQSVQKTVERQAQEISSFMEERAEKDLTIVFMVQLSKPLTGSIDGAMIVFDTVMTNYGEAYKNASGVFISPTRGLYQFHLTASSAVKTATDKLRLNIMKNNERTGYIFLDRNSHYSIQRTTSVILELEAGETVYVQVTHAMGSVQLLNCCFHTHFSGHLLHVL